MTDRIAELSLRIARANEPEPLPTSIENGVDCPSHGGWWIFTDYGQAPRSILEPEIAMRLLKTLHEFSATHRSTEPPIVIDSHFRQIRCGPGVGDTLEEAIAENYARAFNLPAETRED